MDLPQKGHDQALGQHARLLALHRNHVWHPSYDNFENQDAFTADMINAFKFAKENLPREDAPTVVANSRNFTDAAVNTGYQLVHGNVLDQICMACLINFLLADGGDGKETHHNCRKYQNCC